MYDGVHFKKPEKIEYGDPNKNRQKYYMNDINVISDNINCFHGKKYKENHFYIDSIDKIEIQDVIDYKYGFTSRFFYGIFDFNENKGWIRLHGIPSDDFLIKAGLIEDGYYDVKILDNRGVYGLKKEIENRHNIRYKNRFDNGSRECFNLISIKYILRNIGASTRFIEAITQETPYYSSKTNVKNIFKARGKNILRKLFNSQLKLLKIMKSSDKNRVKLGCIHYGNNIDLYEDIFGYTPKDRYKKKYKLMLKYLTKEIKILFYINKIKQSEGIEKDYAEEFFNNLLKISNTNNPNFKERKKIILAKYKELFNNK